MRLKKITLFKLKKSSYLFRHFRRHIWSFIRRGGQILGILIRMLVVGHLMLSKIKVLHTLSIMRHDVIVILLLLLLLIIVTSIRRLECIIKNKTVNLLFRTLTIRKRKRTYLHTCCCPCCTRFCLRRTSSDISANLAAPLRCLSSLFGRCCSWILLDWATSILPLSLMFPLLAYLIISPCARWRRASSLLEVRISLWRDKSLFCIWASEIRILFWLGYL